MDAANASGAPIWLEVHGDKLEFGLLSVRDFGRLQNMIELDEDDPRGSRAFIRASDVCRWCVTAMGCVPTILMARQKIEPKATAEQVEAMGTLAHLSNLADRIVDASLGLLDPPAPEPDEGKAPSQTTQAVGTG